MRVPTLVLGAFLVQTLFAHVCAMSVMPVAAEHQHEAVEMVMVPMTPIAPMSYAHAEIVTALPTHVSTSCNGQCFMQNTVPVAFGSVSPLTEMKSTGSQTAWEPAYSLDRHSIIASTVQSGSVPVAGTVVLLQ